MLRRGREAMPTDRRQLHGPLYAREISDRIPVSSHRHLRPHERLNWETNLRPREFASVQHRRNKVRPRCGGHQVRQGEQCAVGDQEHGS